MTTQDKLADAIAYITRKIADHEQLMATVERMAKAGRWEGVASYREATENLPALRNVLEALAEHDAKASADYVLVPMEPTEAMELANGTCMFPQGQEWLREDARKTWAAMLAAWLADPKRHRIGADAKGDYDYARNSYEPAPPSKVADQCEKALAPFAGDKT